MNTVKSFWVGMGSLTVAGGAAYFFAKRQINEDRATRFEADRRRQQMQKELEYASKQAAESPASAKRDAVAKGDTAGSPSREISSDPSLKSKFEPEQPFTSTKGDRFS